AAVGYLSGAATPVATMTAVDPNSDTYSWSISGGADSAKFSINSSTGALTFLSSPNFSVPTDVDGDNKYQVEVTVTDSKGGVDKQTLSVEVAASADATAPTRTATYPADGATGVAVNSNLSITFNETIQAGTGSIKIYDSSGTLATSIPVTDSRQIKVVGSTLYLDPRLALDTNTSYYVQYDAGVVKDKFGNAVASLNDNTSFNFTTANNATGDATAPTLSSTGPADNATGVARNASLTLTFSETIAPDSGYISIYK